MDIGQVPIEIAPKINIEPQNVSPINIYVDNGEQEVEKDERVGEVLAENLTLEQEAYVINRGKPTVYNELFD